MVELKKRLNLGSLMRKRSSQDVNVDPNADTPEANAARGVRLFCESGAANSGEEVLHLPTIVESAVASPAAAAAAARQIRVFLSKENYSRPHVQYNAVMLIRILADNPGPSFTKNMDKQFADTIKHLLRNGQDPSVGQIVRESLDSMEREKAYDTNLNVLFAMWRKEKGLMASAAKQFGPRKLNAPGWSPGQQVSGGFSSGSRKPKTLPPPSELAGRIEEARTSAKLLLQLVQSTPANELLGNELVKEFAERCTTAQRSIHGYIACDNPAPDDDTMLTLIETNEQLSLAASKHQRAILQARKHMGASPSPPIRVSGIGTFPMPPTQGSATPPHGYAPPPGPPQSYGQQSYGEQAYGQSSPTLPPHNTAPTLPPINAATTESMQSPSSPPTTWRNDDSSIPASLQAAPNRPRPTEQDENPFADHYTSTFTPHSGPPPAQQDSRSNGHVGSPDSYHPGYQSTPSYLGRQESSANNLTMHGAQSSIPEGNERPRTPELHGSQHQQQSNLDVSPVAERNTVTYRY